MNLEDKISEAIIAELSRQAEEGNSLTVQKDASGLRIEGRVDIEAVAMAVAGALAGGP